MTTSGAVLAFPPYPVHDVAILGAGFSVALSDHMPLTDELGNILAQELHDRFGEPLREFRDGQFEVWLSSVAEDQPYPWPDDNFLGRASFSRYTAQLAEVIERRTTQAIDEGASKPWIFPWLGALHARRATLLTFNQDTLVERLIDMAGMPSWDFDEWIPMYNQPRMGWTDATNGIPALGPPGGLSGGAPKKTFRLYKLHGSANWFWRSGDQTGATIRAWWPAGTSSGEMAQPDEVSARLRWLPGATAFVVPPASAKSTFYANAVSEALWRKAYEHLYTARSVSLVGYSLPTTDIVTSNMIHAALVALPSGRNATITVVNPCADPVIANLKKLGVLDTRISTFETVEGYARSYVRFAGKDLYAHLRDHYQKTPSPGGLLLVGFALEDARAVVDHRVDCENFVIELLLEEIPLGQPATAVHLRPGVSRLSSGDLANLVGVALGVEWKIVAVGPEGAQSEVVAACRYVTGMAGSEVVWQVLRTAAPVQPAQHVPSVDLSALRPH